MFRRWTSHRPLTASLRRPSPRHLSSPRQLGHRCCSPNQPNLSRLDRNRAGTPSRRIRSRPRGGHRHRLGQPIFPPGLRLATRKPWPHHRDPRRRLARPPRRSRSIRHLPAARPHWWRPEWPPRFSFSAGGASRHCNHGAVSPFPLRDTPIRHLRQQARRAPYRAAGHRQRPHGLKTSPRSPECSPRDIRRTPAFPQRLSRAAASPP